MNETTRCWLLPDPHFHHRNLVVRGCRPEGYEHLIRDSWVRQVSSEDTVYCLGDVNMGKPAGSHEEFVMPMPGRKILIRGNHDTQKTQWYLNHGWDEVHTCLLLEVAGQKVLLSHKPQADTGSYDLNVHGHFHNDLHRAMEPEMVEIRSPKQRLLALECVNYELVSLTDFVAGRVIQVGLPEYG